MAKVAEVTEKETWGTWEELLLTCAVSRHGTKSWDSVAMEIQNRSSSFNILTAQNCEQRYYDLKCRFMEKDDKIDDGDEESETDDRIDRIPWLDELRKVRVAELRREVQQYDVSIVSLQLKVNRLKEERERSLIEENSDEKPDLEKDSETDNVKYDKKEGDEEPNKSSPASVAGNSVPGEVSDRENQSFNESNSTDPKGENRETSLEETDINPEPLEIAARKRDRVSGESKPAHEGSFNGSSDTIAKDSLAPTVGKSSKTNPGRETSNSPESWESVAESKGGGEEGSKESSDVQSSANLSKKKRRMKVIPGSSSSGDEPETDEVSPAIKRTSVKSEPLISFLEIIRSHKYGSLFERRLESQETEKYRNLIRQHVDLETVRTRLEQGLYFGCSHNFFRDMLLLFNNAIVFFPHNSDQLIAASHLRHLVSKEMAIRTQNPDPSPEEPSPPPPVPPSPEPEPEPSDSLLVKPKITSVPMIVCRKRSSVSAKGSSSGVERKGEQRPVGMEEKPVLDKKQPANPSAIVEEISIITKKRTRTRERSASGARSSRTSRKSRTNTNTSKNPTQNPTPTSNSGSVGKGRAPDENLDPKTEKKNNNNNNTSAIGKKRGAANFLTRMKRNSSHEGTLLESLKSSVNNSNKGKGGVRGVEQKKNGRGDGRKGQVSRQSSAGKQVQGQSSPAKRSVGRPPKKAAAPSLLPPPAPAKRVRETVEKDVLAARQPRKRSRR